MTRTLTNILIFAGLLALAALVWLGRQQPSDPYLLKVLSIGSLRVGMDPTYPPFDMVRDGQVEGYDARLAEAIAGDLGVRVIFKTLALDTLYDALLAGNIDVIISAQPFVYERQKEVRYSAPYYQAGQVLVVRQGESGILSVEQLGGRTVGVELGSNADTEARRLQRTKAGGMQLRSVYRSPEEALDALRSGQTDAAITDNLSAQLYLAANPGALVALSPPITDDPYVVAMPAHADALAAHINGTIERLRASGELARLMGMAEAGR